MRTKLCFIITICFFLSSFSQENNSKKNNTLPKKCSERKNQVIVYDLSIGEFDPNKVMIKPCQNIPTIIKIKNLNMLFYNVKIQGKDVATNDVTLFDSDTTVVKLVKIPEKNFDAIQIIDLSFLNYGNNKTTDQKQDETKKNTDQIAKLSNEIRKIHRNLDLEYDKLDEIDKNKKQLLVLDKTKVENTSTITALEKSLKDSTAILSNIEKYQSELFNKKNEYANEVSSIKDKNVIIEELTRKINQVGELYNNFYKSALTLSQISKRYNNFIDKIYRPELLKSDYEKLRKNEPNELEKTPIINSEKLSEYYAKCDDFDFLILK